MIYRDNQYVHRTIDAMTWINYNHLHYFWRVARHGSVVRAAEELLVSQPTISTQLRELERALGRRLFDRMGRKLVLTDAGHVVLGYADRMFSLGQEMLGELEGRSGNRPVRLAVGIVDMIPKTVVRLLLEPATRLDQAVRMVCREDKADHLLADLAAQKVDLVLSDTPIGGAGKQRGFNHLLGQCGVAFFAVSALAERHKRGFPRSLNNAPMLLPSDTTALRRSLDIWFDANRIRPRVVGEFDDAALLISFGRAGEGVFPAPAVVADEIRREHRVRIVGRTDAMQERFYAITLQDEPTHPAVLAIRDAARRELFK
jgi:LysR family transcriptional activator of nhaA